MTNEIDKSTHILFGQLQSALPEHVFIDQGITHDKRQQAQYDTVINSFLLPMQNKKLISQDDIKSCFENSILYSEEKNAEHSKKMKDYLFRQSLIVFSNIAKEAKNKQHTSNINQSLAPKKNTKINKERLIKALYKLRDEGKYIIHDTAAANLGIDASAEIILGNNYKFQPVQMPKAISKFIDVIEDYAKQQIEKNDLRDFYIKIHEPDRTKDRKNQLSSVLSIEYQQTYYLAHACFDKILKNKSRMTLINNPNPPTSQR